MLIRTGECELSAMTRRRATRHCFMLVLSVAGIITIVNIAKMHYQTNDSASINYSSNISNNDTAPLSDSCLRLVRQDNVSQLHELCRPVLINGSWSGGGGGQHLLNVDARAYPGDYISCVTALSNCVRFRSVLGYIDHVTPEELEFSIAFGLLTYENFEQTERLLRLIYRPHNFYCLHVDAKSPADFHTAADAVASCLPNVIVARPTIKVQWGKVSVVEAELQCIKLLLAYDARWKYYVNLVGRDFPLRTNHELVDILKAYNGANDVDGSRKK